MHSPCTHGCSLGSPGTCFWLLWAGATFRCKGYIQSCFPTFHFCHKQGCTVVRGCTFCYKMALFLFYGLHYWGKGLWKRCAYRSFSTRCCQAWEWSDLYYQSVPQPHKLPGKNLLLMKKVILNNHNGPFWLFKNFFLLTLALCLFDPSNYLISKENWTFWNHAFKAVSEKAVQN